MCVTTKGNTKYTSQCQILELNCREEGGLVSI